MKRYEPSGAFGQPNTRARVALSVLAIVAVLGVGVALGRATAPTAAAPAPPAKPSASAQPSGQVQGQPPQSASVTGPHSIADGVPVGYAHSKAGAVAAATNFGEVVGGPLEAHPDAYRAALRRLAAPVAQQQLLDDGERTMAASEKNFGLLTAAASGTGYVNQTFPLSYRVTSYSDDTATITIWSTHVVAVQGKLPARAVSSAIDVTVAWSGGDWRYITGRGNVNDGGLYPGLSQDTLPVWEGTEIPKAMGPEFTQYGASPNG